MITRITTFYVEAITGFINPFLVRFKDQLFHTPEFQ